MKKIERKIVCILLILSFVSINIFATSITAMSVDSDTVQPRFTYISSVTVGLAIDHDGRSVSDTGVTLYESSHSAKINMTLQRYEDSDWEDVKSWSVTDDGPDIDIEEIWYVVSGYDYRIESTVYVYNANGRLLETTTEYSPVYEF